MRHKPWLSAFAVAVVVAGTSPATGWAQGVSDRALEAFVAAGPGWVWSDESYLGTGVVAGAGIGYRLGRLGVELVADHRRNSPDFGNDVRFVGNRTRVAARALYFMGGAGARPYVGGLIGYSRIHHTSDFPADCEFVDHQPVCRSRERFMSTHHRQGLGAVAGVRMAFRDRWFVRPEFEFALPGEGAMMSATVAIGKSW